MSVFAFVFFWCILLTSSAANIDANDIAENQLAAELRHSPTWTASDHFVWADGCDFSGNDLNAANPPKTNKEDCGASCFNNPECVRFSWDTSRNCYHKKWTATGTSMKQGARCGFIPGRPWTTSGNIVWGDGCDFSGNDLNAANPAKTKKEECGASCLSNPQCVRFSWDTSGNCYHKKLSATVATLKNGARCGFIQSRPRTPPTTTTTTTPKPERVLTLPTGYLQSRGLTDPIVIVPKWKVDFVKDKDGSIAVDENYEQIILYWDTECWFDYLFNTNASAKVKSLGFQACKMNCYNDKTCKNLVWIPDTDKGSIGDCVKYDGKNSKSPYVVPVKKTG